MLLAPRPLKARGDRIGVGLDAPVAKRRQALWVTLAADDRAQDALAGQSHDVGDHRVELDVHLGQRLLHVQDAAGAVPGQPPHLACVGAQRANLVARTERSPQQAVGHQLPDPLAVQHVALAPADLLRHARRHEHHLEARALQRLVDRYPVDRGRFHRHLGHPTRRRPRRHLLQIAGKGAERTHRLLGAFRVDRHEMPVLADVDPCAVRVHHPEALGSSRLARHGTSSQVSSPSRAGRNHVRSPILLIGIGGHLTMPPLPHHRAYGSVPRRFDRIRPQQGCRVWGGRASRNGGCVGPAGPPHVRPCASTPSASQRRWRLGPLRVPGGGAP